MDGLRIVAGRDRQGSSGTAPDARQELLERRASQLSRAPATQDAGKALTDLVEFRIGDERYAVESEHVGEVHHTRDVTAVPCTPSFVLGVINVRGRIIPVLDLRTLFDLPGHAQDDMCRVLILRSTAMEFGVLADAILGVNRLCLTDLQPTLPTLGAARNRYLHGISGDRLIVLDARKLLADRDLVVHEDVTG